MFDPAWPREDFFLLRRWRYFFSCTPTQRKALCRVCYTFEIKVCLLNKIAIKFLLCKGQSLRSSLLAANWSSGQIVFWLHSRSLPELGCKQSRFRFFTRYNCLLNLEDTRKFIIFDFANYQVNHFFAERARCGLAGRDTDSGAPSSPHLATGGIAY